MTIEPTSDTSPVTKILYTNWRGETSVRKIRLHVIAYGNEVVGLAWASNEWHPEEQWLLNAYDVEKGGWRTFALTGIKAWGEDAINAALADPLAPTPSPGSHAEFEGLKKVSAWLEREIGLKHQDSEAHPEGSRNRSFYAGQTIAYENVLSFVEGERSGRLVSRSAPGAVGEDWRTVLNDARAWVEHAVAPLRPLSPEAARPGGELLQRIDAAIASPTAPAQVGDGWLPIETAPRDNTPVLLGFWAKPSDDPAEWRWTAVSGWYEAGPADRCWYEDLTEEPIHPTHWMPLPASPSKTREG